MPETLGRRLRPLRVLLARLYPSERDCKRVLSESGVAEERLSSGEPALTLWHEGLTTAARLHRLPAVVEIASEEFPHDAQQLREYLAAAERHLPKNRSAERLRRLLAEAEAAAAEVLDWPSTLPSGAEIARAEQQQIERLISDPQIDAVIVLGEAGCGKSALLATIGRALRNAGRRVLGMRLDRLPKGAVTDEDLQRYLNLSEPFVEVVEALASEDLVTIIIDQLDALCDLMTERAGRLALILNTVECLAEIPNVHVILASRPFEYRHDVRLRRVHADEVFLDLPAWNDVEPHLLAVEIDAALLSPDLREELRRPQALRTFLELIAQGHDWSRLTTYHAMREHLWMSHVNNARDGERRRRVLFDLALWMANEEVLTRPMAQVDQWQVEIGELESAGWLRRVGLEWKAGLTFRHQSLFEFVYARALVATSGSFSEQVLKHQGLFIRRRVWSVLSYLREASPDHYRREFDHLWGTSGLRRHLKGLLIDFIGQLPEPTLREVALLRRALGNPMWTTHTWRSASRGRSWFEHLRGQELPRAMADSELADFCVPLLIEASGPHSGSVLELVEQHWMHDPNRQLRAASVLVHMPDWPERAISLARCLAVQIPFTNNHAIEQLITAAVAISPRLASALFGHALNAELVRRLDVFHATPATPRPEPSADPQAHMAWLHTVEARKKPIQDLFDGPMNWMRLSGLVESAPGEFIAEVWPIMKRGLDAIGRPELVFPCYRAELEFLDDIPHHPHSVFHHIYDAVMKLAQRDSNWFANFLHQEGVCDLMTVHMVLLEGLALTATSHPDVVVDYFRRDRRRMLVGTLTSQGKDTLRCLVRISRELDTARQQELASMFMSWTPLDQLPADWDARRRRLHMHFVRMHRLRLLLSLDAAKLDASTLARLEEEQRAYPDVRRPRSSRPSMPRGGPIQSPMLASQMEKASDEEVLNFFRELTDQTGWEHPRRSLEGGSIEASRELATLTKKDPERGLRIARNLLKATHQRPVGMVIEAAAESGYDGLAIIQLIQECEARGFSSADYRTDAARALEKIGLRDGRPGLPDSVCSLLESWLTNVDSMVADKDHVEDKARPARRILFETGIGHSLPEGNYAILRALLAGLLNRPLSEYDRWLTILEQHLLRREAPRVWQALAHNDLLHLDRANHVRAAALLDGIFGRVPELFDVRPGLYVLDRHQTWLPIALTRGWLETLYARGSRWHAQAYGELLVLRTFRIPGDAWASTEIDRLVASPPSSEPTLTAARHGIAFMSGYIMHEELSRERVGDWLVRLGATQQPAITAALLDVFRFADPPSYDEQIDKVLEVFELHPFHLRNGHLDGLIRAMQAYVNYAPERVTRLASAMINSFSQNEAKSSAEHYASELVDLALTLQDIPGHMEAGLNLFECIQELNLSAVEQVLKEHEVQLGTQLMLRLRARHLRRRSKH